MQNSTPTEQQCIVDTMRRSVNSSLAEPRAMCDLCQNSLRRAATILKNMSLGQGAESDLAELEKLASAVGVCQCGSGKMAAGRLLSSLHQFREEYQEHLNGRCPALVCKPLIHYEIIQSKCHGERCCLPCPENAIKGSFGKPQSIVDELCSKCGKCVTACPYGAVRIYS